MLLLAIDTSTPVVTAALHDGARVVAEATAVDARRHGELLAPQVEEVLRLAGCAPGDLTAVAVGVGPGPFTGLRVGVVTARTLGWALGVRVHGVCSLDAWSLGAPGAEVEGPFAVVTDARRKEVYWATYLGPGRRDDGPGVDRPEALAARLDGRPVLGPATALYGFAGAVGGADGTAFAPTAALVAAYAVARLAAGDTGDTGDKGEAEEAGEAGDARDGLLAAHPLYLRRPDATPPGARKRVLA